MASPIEMNFKGLVFFTLDSDYYQRFIENREKKSYIYDGEKIILQLGDGLSREPQVNMISLGGSRSMCNRWFGVFKQF